MTSSGGTLHPNWLPCSTRSDPPPGRSQIDRCRRSSTLSSFSFSTSRAPRKRPALYLEMSVVSCTIGPSSGDELILATPAPPPPKGGPPSSVMHTLARSAVAQSCAAGCCCWCVMSKNHKYVTSFNVRARPLPHQESYSSWHRVMVSHHRDENAAGFWMTVKSSAAGWLPWGRICWFEDKLKLHYYYGLQEEHMLETKF